MAQKPNYNFQRAERDRAKKAKKEEKLQEKKAAALRGAQEAVPEEDAGSAPSDSAAAPLDKAE